jgi:hypothetical protein
MSLVLKVDILGEYKNLTAATKGAQTQLSSLNKRTAAISNGMSKAFAAIGIGFSLRVITQQLEEVNKAAIEDQKSMNILALAMKNAGNATKEQVAQAEKSINKMQLQSAVADDKLRPAFQKLFIATKDVTQSNRLLQIALDASAATGKDLDAVSQAMAKSLAGSDTALIKLIPSLKGAKDPMAELEKTFKGAAEEAANVDPYQRLTVAFGEIQESIGRLVLPALESFAGYMIDLTPRVLDFFANLNDPTTKTGKSWGNLTKAISTFGDTWTGVEGKISGSSIFTFIVDGVTGVINAFNAAGTVITSQVEGWKQLLSFDFAGGMKTINEGISNAGRITGGSSTIQSGLNQLTGAAKKTTTTTGTSVTQNIRITGSQSAAQIAQKITKAQKTTGTPVINRGMF